MNALAFVLSSKRFAVPEHQVSAERGSKMNACRERRYEFLTADSSGRIREAYLWDVETRNRTRLSYARPRDSVCEV